MGSPQAGTGSARVNSCPIAKNFAAHPSICPCSVRLLFLPFVHSLARSFIRLERLEGKEEGLAEDSDEEVPDESAGGLFSCPKAGCVKVFQRHSSLEKHLSYGKCKLARERDTLVDKAKKLYHAKLVEGASAPPTIQGHTTAQESVPTLREGWALKSSKKSYRFSEAQSNT